MDEGGLFPAPEIFLHHLILCFPLPQRPQQHDIALDGTSSLSYPDPYKNWANKYNGVWTLHLGDTDLVITKYSIIIHYI